MITEKMVRNVLVTVDCGLTATPEGWTPGKMCAQAAVCFALGELHRYEPICVSNELTKLLIGLCLTPVSSNKVRAQCLRRLTIAQLDTANIDERLLVKRLSELVLNDLIPSVLRTVAAIVDEPHKSNLLEAAYNLEMEGTPAADLADAADAANAAVYTACAAYFAADAARAKDKGAKAAYAACAAAHGKAAADAAYADAAAEALQQAKEAAKAAADKRAAADEALRQMRKWQRRRWLGRWLRRWLGRWLGRIAAAPEKAPDAHAAAAADQVLSEFAEKVVRILVEMETPGSKWLHLTLAEQSALIPRETHVACC